MIQSTYPRTCTVEVTSYFVYIFVLEFPTDQQTPRKKKKVFCDAKTKKVFRTMRGNRHDVCGASVQPL